jgi:hypothetical protein
MRRLKSRISEDIDSIDFFSRYLFVAFLIVVLNVVVLVSLFILKDNTESLIARNLDLIADVRKSNQEIVDFIEGQHMQELTTDPQTERIFIMLSEHDKKLKALQDTTNLLFDSQYNYAAENAPSPIK